LIWIVSSGISSRANERVSDLQKRLQRQVSITWKGQSLAGALAGLSDRENLGVWLDRRVDPDQSIELALRGVSLQQALEAMARSCDLHVAYMGSIAYLGPDDAASQIMALREKLRGVLENSPRILRQKWFHRSAWTWPRLSEPRRLLQNLFSGTPIKLSGVERVPYDLWDARQLPRMTRVDQATLLLIGFDLTLQIAPDGKRCQVVPIERPVIITRQYTIRANQAPAIARLRRQFPDLNMEPLGTERSPTALRVTGAWSEQQQFRQALEGRPRVRQQRDSQDSVRPDPQGRRVYSLEIREQSLRNVLQQLASQLPVELTWDERQLATSGHSLDIRISCKVRSVSLEQLLEAVLTPAGLHYQRVGRQIRIQAAP
jgi:hypothetical protein